MIVESISTIPIICNRDIFSFRMRCAHNTATGNSVVSSIALSLAPILGIPLENAIGGIIVPKSARNSPHIRSLKLKLLL